MSINSLKPSIAIRYNNDIFTVVNCQHVKMGRGSAFCRVKLKGLMNSRILDCTLRESDNIEQIFVEKRKLQYLYNDGQYYHFIDMETHEDLMLHESHIEDKLIWLKDHLELSGVFHENKLLDLEIPISMELKVIQTDPGFRGNTVKGGSKLAKVETNISIKVPLFINNGDIIKVDTRTKEYLERV